MRGVRKLSPPQGIQVAAAKLVSDLREMEGEGEEREKKRRTRARLAFGDTKYDIGFAKTLQTEQRGLCVYCERAVDVEEGAASRPGRPAATVEHWLTIHDHPEEALSWRNLYLSCPTAETCNSQRGDTDLGLPAPADLAYEHELSWSVGGEVSVRIKPRHLQPEQAERLRSMLPNPGSDRPPTGTLNLNWEPLVKQRARVLQGLIERFHREFPKEKNTRAERAAEAERLLKRKRLPEFVSIQVAFLRGEVPRGAVKHKGSDGD